MASRKLVLLAAAAVIAAVAASVVLVATRHDAARVTASSGSDPSRLVSNTGRDVAWSSNDEAVGAWVQLTYADPTTVNRVRLVGTDGPSIISVYLTFDGGGALLVTADERGDASVAFPERLVSRVRMTVDAVPDGYASVSLAGLSVDGSADSPPHRDESGEVTADASSSDSTAADALIDGEPADGKTGKEWTPADDDQQPWVQLSWPAPREVASAQVFGPSTDRPDVNHPLSGRLVFEDGSSVRVSAIAPGRAEATTIAFAPRVTATVRLELDVATGLREFAVYEVGTTPPRWPQEGPTSTASPPAGRCDQSPTPVGKVVSGRIALVCPAPGSAVEDEATIIVSADRGTSVEASIWAPRTASAAAEPVVKATAVADDEGRARLSLDTDAAPHGPLTVRVAQPATQVRSSDTASTPPLYVQLYNRAGNDVAVPDTAPSGMTLQWTEEFSSPVSVSGTGKGADYSAVKPDASSSGQFGEARFSEPRPGAPTLATIGDEYLRIRTQPAGAGSSGIGSDNITGLLASTDADGAGFAAQYGYFEARILGAPGEGSWPAFWMLDTESAARSGATATEVDAVELYGHNTSGSCHRAHNWGAQLQPVVDPASCLAVNEFADWAMAWHTYGVRVTPQRTVFTIDGEVVATADELHRTAEPLFFLVDLALGGGWPVDLSATGGVTDMYLDWIRVYT